MKGKPVIDKLVDELECPSLEDLIEKYNHRYLKGSSIREEVRFRDGFNFAKNLIKDEIKSKIISVLDDEKIRGDVMKELDEYLEKHPTEYRINWKLLDLHSKKLKKKLGIWNG